MKPAKLSATEKARRARLLRDEAPRWVRVYDSGETSADRYTAIFTGRAPVMRGNGRIPDQYPYLAMSAAPFHPQGFGQHGHTDNTPADVIGGAWAPAIGCKNQLGTRIHFRDLPEDCRKCILRDYADMWRVPLDFLLRELGLPVQG